MASTTPEPGFLTRIVQRIRAATQEVLQGEDAPVSQFVAPAPEPSKVDSDRRMGGQQQKRKDDTIRRREFDYLRKVRSMRMRADPGNEPRPSAFQNSSILNPDNLTHKERAGTVTKINAIEAELIQQWWTHSDSEGAPTRPPDLDMLHSPVGTEDASKATFATPESSLESGMDLDFTSIPLETPRRSAPTTATKPTSRAALVAALALFNDGDFERAEAAFIALLQFPDLDDQTAEICSATLLQIYRATGVRSSFDVVAIEYAQLFGRSAPEWMAIDTSADSSPVPASFDTAQASRSASEGLPVRVWACPGTLDAQELAAIAGLPSPASATVYDWSALHCVDSQVVPELVELLRQWCSQAAPLQMKNLSVLLQIAMQATHAGDRSCDPAWWQLRLEILRLQGRENDFDNVAVDYCITYEISPPSWSAPNCTLVECD